MKVKELIALLKKCPQDQDILMSSDAEGNTIHNVTDLAETKAAIVLWPSHEEVQR